MIHPRSRRRLQLWVDDALSIERMADEQDRRISEAVEQEQSPLRNFIRRGVADEADVEASSRMSSPT